MNATLTQRKKTVICPLDDNRHLIRTEFKEGCFIYQSFGIRKSSFGDIELTAHVSFLADAGNGVAAEWEPQYGPIQVWKQCDSEWTGETVLGSTVKAKSHWHFPFVEDNPGNWSQLAVDDEGLKQMLINGSVDGVFDALTRWALGN
jgi:hypothetical protein